VSELIGLYLHRKVHLHSQVYYYIHYIEKRAVIIELIRKTEYSIA